MNEKIEALRRDIADKSAVIKDIKKGVVASDADYTPEQEAKIDSLLAECDESQAQIEQLEAKQVKQEALNARINAREEYLTTAQPRKTQASIPLIQANPDKPEISGMRDVGDQLEDSPTRGFKNSSEFCMSVMEASRPGVHEIDFRLLKQADEGGEIRAAAATTYGNENTGVDGGFLVPPEYSSSIREHSLTEEAFLPLTDNIQVSGNGMSFPSDETTPWGTDGVRAYWTGEAGAATQTKPAVKERNLRLHKLMALVPVTDELLTDASALGQFVVTRMGRSIMWETNDAIMNGNGSGKPLGIANSGAIVSQTKEVSQTADTIVAGNAVKMFSRCTNPGRAVWVVNHDAYPQLPLMTIGNQPVFTSPTEGIKTAPAGNLLGRPVILSQTMQTVGNKGDIRLCDFGAYQTITKAGDIEFATSIHLFFDYGQTAFRATFRIDGKPWLASSITANNGSTTLSPFVELDARA